MNLKSYQSKVSDCVFVERGGVCPVQKTVFAMHMFEVGMGFVW